MDHKEPPWAEYEKVYMLAEIIKAAPFSSHALYNLIREANIAPKWSEIPLPYGRSLRSCQFAFHELANAGFAAQEYRHPDPRPTPVMYPAAELPKKRPHSESSTPTGRYLQPRPPFPTDIMARPTYPTQAVVNEPASRKKRGRPTKAEIQARQDAAAARGEVYPPPRRERAPKPPPLLPDNGTVPMGPSSALPSASSTATPGGTAILTPTTLRPYQSEESPGAAASPDKNKRAKFSGSEELSGQVGEQGMSPPSTRPGSRHIEGIPGPLLYQGQQHQLNTPTSLQPPSSASSSVTTAIQSSLTHPSPHTQSPPNPREPELRLERSEEVQQPRTHTPRSFKETVGM